MQNHRANGVIQVMQAHNSNTNESHEWYVILHACIVQEKQLALSMLLYNAALRALKIT